MEKMKKLDFEKTITITKELGRFETMYQINYKNLSKEVENDKQLNIQFPKGDFKIRMKQIKDLGFEVVEWIWTPEENAPIFSKYRAIIERV